MSIEDGELFVVVDDGVGNEIEFRAVRETGGDLLVESVVWPTGRREVRVVLKAWLHKGGKMVLRGDHREMREFFSGLVEAIDAAERSGLVNGGQGEPFDPDLPSTGADAFTLGSGSSEE